MPDFDLAVIGAGSAGLSVTAVAARLGLRVALIERGRMGGDCLNTGCVPSKALLAAAHAAMNGAAAVRFGVAFGAPRIDWDGVRAHVAGVIAGIAPTDSEERFRGLGAAVMRDHARFVAPDTLAVGGRRITARRIVVAAGSRPAVPEIPGLTDVPYLTHETLFDLPEKPGHLLVLGGGAIGLEMAQAHAGLGSRVTIVEAQTLARREDPALVASVRDALLAQGVSIHEGSSVLRVERGPALVLANGERLCGTHLLIATGRRPNVEDVGLENGGVTTTPAGIATDRGLRSRSNRRVFAAGDIADPAGIGPQYFTHAASHHASVILRRALFRVPARLVPDAIPRVTYTDPELAQVGLTEAEARARGLAPVVTVWPVAENDRARTERRTEGVAKLVATRGGRILGAGIVAPHAGEMIGAWTLAIARRIPLSAMASMIMPYPTRAETAKRAAGHFFEPRLFAPRTRWVVKQLARLV
ncbi:MAG TPA: FAD-dependent oxidoreductase [Acetobacteraceae bacterium]|nr:FAD-dependent oxidoreductase [Acetobacteraceae bacterium]